VADGGGERRQGHLRASTVRYILSDSELSEFGEGEEGSGEVTALVGDAGARFHDVTAITWALISVNTGGRLLLPAASG